MLGVDEWMAADFVAYCLDVYQQRTAELDGELCRLALMLQPQYKPIAVPDGKTSALVHKVLKASPRSCRPAQVHIALRLGIVTLL